MNNLYKIAIENNFNTSISYVIASNIQEAITKVDRYSSEPIANIKSVDLYIPSVII